MAILGDYTTADKFYIINSKGDIEWVPSLKLAEKYTKNPNFKEWYNKDIYATNEDFVIKNNKVYLKSAYEKNIKNSQENIDNKSVLKSFEQQAQEYINFKLLEFSQEYKYDNIYTMISWKDSKIEKYKKEAELAIEYRDLIYTYHFNYLNFISEEILKLTDNLDISNIYSKYIENFPKIK